MTSGKLDSKSDRCKFVGYPKETKGYEFYHPTDNKIFVARNGTFLEKEFLSAISSGRKAVENTPYELWRGTKPNLSYLRIWGCDVYVRRLMTSGKLDSKSDRCKFVGYPKETKGYEFYHPTDNKIFVARNGTFLEKEFRSAISSGRKVDLEEIREPQEEISIAVEPERQGLVSRPAQTWLSENFAMKDLRNASYALGIRIYRDRYQGNLGEAHWTAVKNILKYLRNTKDAFLVYGGEEELKVIGYTDASFQTDRDDYKSQVGYVFCLNGRAFSWKSSKKDTTADSTTEAEYMAAAEAAKEGVWIKKFISELGVVPSINDPIPLFCDNTGAIAQEKEPRSHKKTKHIVRLPSNLGFSHSITQKLLSTRKTKNARVDLSIDEGRLRKAFLKKAVERYANFTYNQRNPTQLMKKKMDPRPFEQLKKAEKKGGPVQLDEVIIHTKTKKHDGKTWVDPEHAELQDVQVHSEPLRDDCLVNPKNLFDRPCEYLDVIVDDFEYLVLKHWVYILPHSDGFITLITVDYLFFHILNCMYVDGSTDPNVVDLIRAAAGNQNYAFLFQAENVKVVVDHSRGLK
ncbi:unnamed protein product [Cuscuta campestris]|uniref:Retroviral polymerase SH3-like domain-containing protein n=1 Tax=Cuscuta campestris TaxID=132261 RepID=A0A484N6P2_9ASTE|nr:unnamed protein product [Cuscuta campestris]